MERSDLGSSGITPARGTSLRIGELVDRAIHLTIKNLLPLFVILAPIRLVGDGWAVTQQSVMVDDFLTQIAPTVHAIGIKLHMHSHPAATGAWLNFVWIAFLLPLGGALAVTYCDNVSTGNHFTLLQSAARGFARWPSALLLFWTFSLLVLVLVGLLIVSLGVLLGLLRVFVASGAGAGYFAGFIVGIVGVLVGLAFCYVPALLAFCAVVVDKQPLFAAIRFGLRSQFRRGRVLAGLGAALAIGFITGFLNYATLYGGFIAFGLTGSDALDVVVQVLGGVVLSGFLANAAIILYRDYQSREAAIAGSAVL